MAERLRVRVGVVSWNTADLLDRCLRALPAALGRLAATVVVVDNASGDDSAGVARRHAGVRVVVNEANAGYATAMNQALGGAGADVLIALNPDTEPSPGSLEILVERLLASHDVGLVSPKLRNVDGTLQHTVYRFPSIALAAVGYCPPPLLRRRLGARWWIEGYSPHDRPCDVDWLVGAVHVIRAEAVDPARPYRERSFMYAEDIDLCWQLAQRGWRRRLEADVEIVHVGNAAGAQAWGDRRVDRYVRATSDWYADTRGKPRARAWAGLTCVGLAARLLVRRGDAECMARQLRAYAGALVGRRAIHPT